METRQEIVEESLRRKPGRPPRNARKAPAAQARGKGRRSGKRKKAAPLSSPATNGSTQVKSLNTGEDQLYPPDDVQLTPFSSLLRDILHRDRAEIARVARELEVAENTVYRWMNGNSVPRVIHLKKMPDVFPEHRSDMMYAINQTFPDVLDMHSTGLPEVHKDIYIQILDLVATIDDPSFRFWQVAQALFEHALQHLDAEHRGMAITYAALMPPYDDGIHSLHEMIMRGTPPWPATIETRAYLGSTTLAGMAATWQRMQVWNKSDNDNRLLVEIDEHEASACAVPVMRGGRPSGVLIASSRRPDFFKEPMTCKALDEYAHLLATALTDQAFYAHARVGLRPMPPLQFQRERISKEFVPRVLENVQKYRMSRSEAEAKVSREMEQEFEKQVEK